MRAGDEIGSAARSPIHVRFELHESNEGGGFVAIDPLPRLSGWGFTPNAAELRQPYNDNEAA